jgi:hypothetical protein
MARKPIEKFFVVPGPFGPVRDPITMRMLSDKGEWKPKNMYWLRKVKMRDVVDKTSEKRAHDKQPKLALETEQQADQKQKKGESK